MYAYGQPVDIERLKRLVRQIELDNEWLYTCMNIDYDSTIKGVRFEHILEIVDDIDWIYILKPFMTYLKQVDNHNVVPYGLDAVLLQYLNRQNNLFPIITREQVDKLHTGLDMWVQSSLLKIVRERIKSTAKYRVLGDLPDQQYDSMADRAKLMIDKCMDAVERIYDDE